MDSTWRDSICYTVFRPYVDWCTRTSFSRLRVVGRENIPADAAIILAPNHCNTLMDALVVLQANRKPSAYGARADIFRRPRIGAALRWLRILPMARLRDGREALAGNEGMFDEVVECIDHGVPFCIFSEGTHRPKRSLLPLRKGIFRVATLAAKRLDKPVYIVPVGIEYDDYFRYMKSACVSFGEPIRVYADSDREEVMTTLHDRIASLITYFPDDENYDAAEAAWEASRRPHFSPWLQALRVAGALLSLPLFALTALLCCPMWIAAWVIGERLGDKAWINTVRFVTKLALLPVLALLVGIPAFILLPWYWALALLVALALSHSTFYLLQGWYYDIVKSFLTR